MHLFSMKIIKTSNMFSTGSRYWNRSESPSNFQISEAVLLWWSSGNSTFVFAHDIHAQNHSIYCRITRVPAFHSFSRIPLLLGFLQRYFFVFVLMKKKKTKTFDFFSDPVYFVLLFSKLPKHDQIVSLYCLLKSIHFPATCHWIAR